jgi:antirestriction protein
MSRVYVSTYKKYNEGSLGGDWVDLDGLDKDDFAEACKTLHEDETDPELMFQAWDDVPDSLVSESSISDSLWDWLELDDSEKEIVGLYWDNVCSDDTVERALESFCGVFESEKDYAEDYLDSTGMWGEIPEWAQAHFDVESFANDLYDSVVYVRHNYEVWVYSRN